MNYMKKAIICEYCGKEMRLDADYNFKGDKDNYCYWICDNCNICAFEKIRYGESVSVKFYREDDIGRKK